MSKTIKFNLICDENPVRTINDLQNNFSIEDILKYYKNKLLHKWLSVRGYSSYLGRINDIKSSSDFEIIKNLINIFNIDCDGETIDESLYILQFRKNEIEWKEKCQKNDNNIKQIIKQYEDNYHILINKIIENKEDISIIKSCVNTIATEYSSLLNLDYRSLFYKIMSKSKLAVLCMLMNNTYRKYFLPIADSNGIYDIESDFDKNEMYNKICRDLGIEEIFKEYPNIIRSYSGKTESYWRDIEEKGKKYIIITISTGDYVRSAGVRGEELGYSDIKNKFLILDGLDYKSNYDLNKVVYMEI